MQPGHEYEAQHPQLCAFSTTPINWSDRSQKRSPPPSQKSHKNHQAQHCADHTRTCVRRVSLVCKDIVGDQEGGPQAECNSSGHEHEAQHPQREEEVYRHVHQQHWPVGTDPALFGRSQGTGCCTDDLAGCVFGVPEGQQGQAQHLQQHGNTDLM